MSWARVELVGEPSDSWLSWSHNNNGSEELPAAGDIVELSAPIPGRPGISDPRHILSVRVLHRVWHNDDTVSLACERLHTALR